MSMLCPMVRPHVYLHDCAHRPIVVVRVLKDDVILQWPDGHTQIVELLHLDHLLSVQRMGVINPELN